jgi:vancomycin resistance protein YoaR
VTDLGKVTVREGGVPAVQEAFSSVRSDAEQVVDDAGSQYRTQTDGLTADVQAVQTAIEQALAGPTPATLSAVVGSIGALVDDVSALADDVSSTC